MLKLREILERVANGRINVDEAEKLLRVLAVEEVEDLAKIDVGRETRKGIPEVILAEGKSPDELAEIAVKMLKKNRKALISRASTEQMQAVKRSLPDSATSDMYSKAKMMVIKQKGYVFEKSGGKIGILTAGTSDIPVAEEARIISEEMGCEVITVYDVGVAGIHRMLLALKKIEMKDVDVVIVVAGREGALPTIVTGIVSVPVIAVPTSMGYGLGEKGYGALTAMLQSCSLGLAVVNIDGGVSAGAVATLIANRAAKFRKLS